MADQVTDAQVAEAQERVAALSDELANAKAAAGAAIRAADNQVRLERLKAEEDRLSAELDAVQVVDVPPAPPAPPAPTGESGPQPTPPTNADGAKE